MKILKFVCDGCGNVRACKSPDGRSLLCLLCRLRYRRAVITRIFALSLITVLTTLGTGASSAEATQERTQVNIYESPCYQREREARGIPRYSVHEGRGLVAYVHAHLNGNTPDAELADYWAALDACRRDHPVPRWDFGSMVLVGVEYLG